MKAKEILVLLFGGFGYIAMVGTSHAVDSKIHPGSMCQAYFGSQEASLKKGTGWVFNDSGGAMWITCPVVRDNTTNTNGVDVAYVRILRASTASAAFDCTLDSRTTTGSQYAWDTASYSGVGNTSLRFDLNASSSRGHYEFLCRLPRDSAIISYRVDEY